MIAFHPQSHIAVDEHDAYQHVTQLQAIPVGTHDTPIKVADLKHLTTMPAALVIEMPLRRAGFKLAAWDELKAISDWCQQNQVHLHMDGARLWESAPFYQQDVTAICQLFDSAYISLYKGIGGLSGALLVGDTDLIEACDLWRNRLGSQMWSNFPALITGLEGIDNNIPLIHQWVARAKQIATTLSDIHELIVATPQTNGFLIKCSGDSDTINERMSVLIQKMNMKPCKPWQPSTDGHLFTEIQVGANHQEITDEELFDFFKTLTASSS